LTHVGSSYQATSIATIKAVTETERLAEVAAAKTLEQYRYVCEMVSAGSSPTAIYGECFDGRTVCAVSRL
jgi:D-serine deaminase-like pyridoxal phosphate-dependent protein